MKSGNYDDLMDKFYAGTASTDEISLLKSEGLINQQDSLYAETLKAERGQKMDWEFEDFIDEIPSAKVVALPVRRIRIKRMIAAAAMVAAALTAYIFWPQHQQFKEIANVPGIHKPVDSTTELIAGPVLPAGEIKNPVTVEKEKTEFPQSNNFSAKTRKENTNREKTSHPDEEVETKVEVGGFQVMVNGKPITNKEDAIAITRESIAMISQNLTTTIDELNPLGKIKF